MKRNGNSMLPHNIEAEEATLGALLVDPDSVLHTLDAGINPADFYDQRHRWIFEAIGQLQAEGLAVDLVTLADRLEQLGRLREIGGAAYISQIIARTPSGLWAAHYAKIVKRTSVLRQLIDVGAKITQMAHSDELDASEAVQAASDMLLDVTRRNQAGEPLHVEKYCSDFIDLLDRLHKSPGGIAGIPTGLTDVDRLLGGLQRGRLYLLAGRPAMGKSSLALQFAVNAARNHRVPVLYFSLEMLGLELVQRMVSMEAKVDGALLSRGPVPDALYNAVLTAADQTTRLPLHIDDQTVSIEDIRARCITQQFKSGLGLVVIDYVQRVRTSEGKRYQSRDAEVGAISSALKQLANSLNVPVVAVASLSRACEARHDKRPMLSDLRESGNLEYDADVVMFAYRDEVYNPDTDFPNIAELIVSKHRGGAIGAVSLFFRKEQTAFFDLTVHREPLYPV